MCYYCRRYMILRRVIMFAEKYSRGAEGYRFSIIMPCYNSEHYVMSAIQSITGQNYGNWELIAINDGSTDRTLEIVNAEAEKDPRIRVFSKPNGGYVSAVNLGLEHITGDYFLLMGSDDALASCLFRALNEAASGGSPDCIAFRSVVIQNGENLGVESITNFSGAVSQFDTTLAGFSRDYPEHAEIFFTRDTSKCYKATLLQNIRYLGRYGFDADGIFSMMLCHNANSFAAIPVDGYFRTIRKDSLSGRKSFFAQDLDRMEVWTAFYSYLLLRDSEEIAPIEKNFLYYFLNITESVWKQGTPVFAHLYQVRSAVNTINAMLKKMELCFLFPANPNCFCGFLLYGSCAFATSCENAPFSEATAHGWKMNREAGFIGTDGRNGIGRSGLLTNPVGGFRITEKPAWFVP